jgi:hypothetical protein
MKSLLFFVLSLHMQMISSKEYKKYILKSSLEKEETQNLVSKGFSYMFNNKKCETYIVQAHKFTEIDKLLADVKDKLNIYWTNVHKNEKKEEIEEKTEIEQEEPIEESVRDLNTTFEVPMADKSLSIYTT